MTRASAGWRVLQVMEATLGGTRRYLEDVFDALGEGPHNGLVYSLHRADAGFRALLDRVRAAGWALFEVDMRRRIDVLNDAAAVFALRDVYRAFRPDVVHAHSSKAGAVVRLATIGMQRRPSVVYTPNSIGVNLNRIYRPIEQLLGLRLDVLAAVTPSERDELQALKLVPHGRIRIVYPTIRSELFMPRNRAAARESLGLADGPLVVAIGRLTAQKNPLAFVDIVDALRRRVTDLRGVWVGDGELRASMEERIAAQGLGDSLTITGWLDDVRTHLAACDLFLSTSAYESFGYVTAEALAMNRPVVASKIAGTVDIVTTDVDDQLYSANDVTAAVALVERLLRDRDHAMALAEQGREYVLSTFSAEATRRGLVDAYAAALQR